MAISGANPNELVCPRCGKVTGTLKRHRFYWLGFFVLGFTCYEVLVVACPGCMRRFLKRWGLISLLTANVLFPLVVFPILIPRFVGTFTTSDSSSKTALKKLLGDVSLVSLFVATGFAVVALIWLTFGQNPPQGMLLTVFGAAVAGFVFFGVIGALTDA